ncbi:glycosyltransferase family 2 protein [Acidihalobacter ferrooxydans]|uniref:Glycosyltransferase 2-like domain-containing protein n=1 Tax=Acidihalobacter ferrooxydans TaxID=1765967 RepID=A0A1P8UI21_9GAMM|nr:glycosyltransferase family A protein [Acidihalobacter ferrooxydans]APZ43478.1 hypothetical protein BW247_10575 [Acidihalobacter ferrooxydans]
MRESHRVSVVVPVFNRAGLLPETLECIFGQTHPADEIIVVNDGSTDTTSQVLTSFSSRIRVIDIANSGDMVAKNVGLKHANGDLVAFCDSDDLWMPEYLQEMTRFWSLWSGITVAYADFCEVHDGVWQSESKFQQAPEGFWDDLRTLEGEHGCLERSFVSSLLQYQPFFPSCMMVDRKRFLAAGGWDESVGRVVGCDFATHLQRVDDPPIGVLRRPLVGIRKHAQNFSGDNLRMELGDAYVLQTILDRRDGLARFESEIQRSIQSRLLAAFEIAYARGDLDLVRELRGKIDESVLGRTHWLKYTIARLPSSLRDPLWRSTVLAGTAKGRWRGKKRTAH